MCCTTTRIVLNFISVHVFAVFLGRFVTSERHYTNNFSLWLSSVVRLSGQMPHCTITLCGNQRPTFPSADVGQTLRGPAPQSPLMSRVLY